LTTTTEAPVRGDLVTTRARWRTGDGLFRGGVSAAGAVTILIVIATAVFLVIQAFPALARYGVVSFLTSAAWAPSEAATAAPGVNPYGILQFIYGTIITSVIAMVIAVIFSVGVALVITDIAPQWMRRPLSYLVDLLAAIPSVVYGFWGIFAFLPAIKPIGAGISDALGGVPVIGAVFAGPFFGPSYVAAALVLAIMVLPIVTALCREVFAVAPIAEKEAALALGATRWEMLRMAVLPRSRSGIVGASILGLGRAIGETIAVTMLIGNSVQGISASIFGQGATMPSVIANEFTEATEPFHLPSLFVVAAWLFVIAIIVNVAGKLVIRRAGETIA
jgi:phosphate transport system permease protein